MSDLLTLQRDMMQWLATKSGDIDAQVIGTKKVSVETRLAIYANAYRYRLLDALSDNYPSVHTLLGDEDFYQEGLKYISQYPSHHFSIRYFGSHLEPFLAEYHQETAILAEMARFEWALRNAFDASDQAPIGLEALQNVDPEAWAGLRFTLHPSVTRLDLIWNTPQIWTVIDEASEQIPFEEAEYPIAWLIWRKALKTYYRSLDVDEAWALDVVKQGKSFGEICEGIGEWVDEAHAPARVAGFIAEWLAADLITAIDSGSKQ